MPGATCSIRPIVLAIKFMAIVMECTILIGVVKPCSWGFTQFILFLSGTRGMKYSVCFIQVSVLAREFSVYTFQSVKSHSIGFCLTMSKLRREKTPFMNMNGLTN